MTDASTFAISNFVLAHGKTIQFALFFGLLATVAGAEALAPGLAQPAQRRRRWPANLALTATNLALAPIIPVSVLGAAFWAEAGGFGLLNPVELPVWATLMAALGVMSLASYLTHRLSHEVAILWRLHRVHHSDTHLDVSTTVRMHPLELIVTGALQASAVALFGLAPWAVVIHETLKVAVILFTHGNVRLPAKLDPVVRWLFVTPDMHRIHHSSLRRETDSNYGAVFSIWDRLFGSYVARPERGYDEIEFGLGELRGRKSTGFWWHLWSPFVRDYVDRPPARTALETIWVKRSEEEAEAAPARR